MKKTLKIVAICLTFAIALCGTATFGWFSASDTIIFPSSFGSISAAYFSEGDGSKQNPYVITTDAHMYNFAWLQYLGYFNLNPEMNNGRAQSYFRLGNDVSMKRTAIPPIGTSEYPFIGSFDGGHHTVYSVTSSNAKSDFKIYPFNARFDENGTLNVAGGGAQVKTVGLFGVTGDAGDLIANGNNAQYNAGGIVIHNKKENDSSSLEETPAAPGGKDLYFSSMRVANFYADVLRAKSVTDETLIGLAAGYVKSGFENVGVYRGDITLKKSATGLDGVGEVSKYALIGDYDAKSVGWTEEPSAGSGAGSGWNGSLNFHKLTQRLNYMISAVAQSGYRNTTVYKGSNPTKNLTFEVQISGPSGSARTERYGREFYWEGLSPVTVGTGTSAQYAINFAYCDIKDGSYLPLGVRESEMGLDGGETVVYLTADKDREWHTNEWYKNSTVPELVHSANTGYIVGGGTQPNGGSSRVRIQPIPARDSSSSTIYNSLINPSNENFYGSSTQATYAAQDNNLVLYTKNSDNQSDPVKILDNYNGVYDVVTKGNYITSASLLNYDKSRPLFKDFLGMNGYLYGMRFEGVKEAYSPYLVFKPDNTPPDCRSITNADGKEEQFLKNTISFNVKESGVVTAVLGAYSHPYQGVDQTAFGLYKVGKNAATGKIESIQQVERVYSRVENGKEKYFTVFANENDDFSANASYKKAYDRSWFDKLKQSSAYYIEIPVEAGDYAISKDLQSSVELSAYINYLDIGASGNSSTQTTPYMMRTVDFVDRAVYDATDKIIKVPSNGDSRYYPKYADVGAKLSLPVANATVAFRRDTAGGSTSNVPYTADGRNTTLYYRFFAANGGILEGLSGSFIPPFTVVGLPLAVYDDEMAYPEDI